MRGILAGVVATALGLAIACVAGCDSTNECYPGQDRVEVQPYQGTALQQDFICLNPPDAGADDIDAAPVIATGTNCAGGSIGGSATLPAEDASVDAGADAAPAPVCGDTGYAGALDVHVLVEHGETPAPPTGTVPDGIYVLAQATWRATDGGAPIVPELRAELSVVGARLVLSAVASNDGTARTDSATATLANGALTTVCTVGFGSTAAELFPATGASEPAAIGWDGSALTLVIQLPSGTLELVFFVQ